MKPVFYDSAKLALWSAQINLESDPINMMLVTDAYVSDPSHKTLADITGEVVATGYTAGGQPLKNQALVVDLTTHQVEFKSDPTQWTSPSLSAAGFILYKVGPTPVESPLIAAFDISGSIQSVYTVACDPTKGYLSN